MVEILIFFIISEIMILVLISFSIFRLFLIIMLWYFKYRLLTSFILFLIHFSICHLFILPSRLNPVFISTDLSIHFDKNQFYVVISFIFSEFTHIPFQFFFSIPISFIDYLKNNRTIFTYIFWFILN